VPFQIRTKPGSMTVQKSRSLSREAMALGLSSRPPQDWCQTLGESPTPHCGQEHLCPSKSVKLGRTPLSKELYLRTFVPDVRAFTGRPATAPDAYIAEIAAVRDFAVATRNVGHFEHTGITVINPWDGPV
jgi:hypothetical protein